VFSIYFVLVIFSSVGYGDYTPGTQAEYILVMFVQILGLLCFSGWIYVVQLIVNEQYDFKAEFWEHELRF
jgi:hypothetical protein